MQTIYDFIKSVFNDLLKGFILNLILFVIIFIFAAVFIQVLIINKEQIHYLFKIVQIVLIYPAYIVFALLATFSFTFIGAILKNLHQMDVILKNAAEPIIQKVINDIPQKDKKITIDEFNNKVDSYIKTQTQYNSPKFKLFSPVKYFFKFTQRIIYQALRKSLCDDLIRLLKNKGKADISGEDIVLYVSNKLISKISENIKNHITIMQIVSAVLTCILVFLPFIIKYLV